MDKIKAVSNIQGETAFFMKYILEYKNPFILNVTLYLEEFIKIKGFPFISYLLFGSFFFCFFLFCRFFRGKIGYAGGN